MRAVFEGGEAAKGTQPMTSQTSPMWSVLLEGHQFDLQDWESFLLPSFDPFVEVVDMPDGAGGSTKAHLLSSSEFVLCSTSSEVREIAVPLIRTLNALASVHNGTRPITFNTIVEQVPGGGFRLSRYMVAEAAHHRIRAAAVALGGAPQKPMPSFVQASYKKATGDVLSALEHYSRADNWHDLYKTYEAVRAHAGGKASLLAAGVTNRDINDFAASAQIIRHHKPSGTPSRVWTFDEGRAFVRKLLRWCLQ